MCNFDLMGDVMGFKMKLIKHMKSSNCERVKDYLCSAYSAFNPLHVKSHPCFDVISQGIDMLKQAGWRIYIGEWKDIGIQFIAESPDKAYYHSTYKHNPIKF